MTSTRKNPSDLTVRCPFATEADRLLVVGVQDITSWADQDRFGAMRDHWRRTLDLTHVQEHPGYAEARRYLESVKDFHRIPLPPEPKTTPIVEPWHA